jgi:chromosome partitioning protein
MRTIMVLNAKGGCGKSTISTNLASYFAFEMEQKVVLADYDPQGSSMAWLEARGEQWPEIIGIAAYKDPVRVTKDTDVIIMDAPARVHGKELTKLVGKVETIIFPVMPSPIDMRAAVDYMKELQATGRIVRGETKIGIVANRVREHTIIFQELYSFLKKFKLPYVATLRDTQNYIKAEERGVGIYEMAPSQVSQDIESFDSLVKWLKSKRSRA